MLKCITQASVLTEVSPINILLTIANIYFYSNKSENFFKQTSQ